MQNRKNSFLCNLAKHLFFSLSLHSPPYIFENCRVLNFVFRAFGVGLMRPTKWRSVQKMRFEHHQHCDVKWRSVDGSKNLNWKIETEKNQNTLKSALLGFGAHDWCVPRIDAFAVRCNWRTIDDVKQVQAKKLLLKKKKTKQKRTRINERNWEALPADPEKPERNWMRLSWSDTYSLWSGNAALHDSTFPPPSWPLPTPMHVN